MERDCMVGYGAAMLLNERLLLSSDAFAVDVCHTCGNIGFKSRCPYCRTVGSTSSVTMPYAFKLLLQEMQGMGIATRLRLEDVDYS
jgi:DNA-directed RNA polymerase III subunit RPC2